MLLDFGYSECLPQLTRLCEKILNGFSLPPLQQSKLQHKKLARYEVEQKMAKKKRFYS